MRHAMSLVNIPVEDETILHGKFEMTSLRIYQMVTGLKLLTKTNMQRMKTKSSTKAQSTEIVYQSKQKGKFWVVMIFGVIVKGSVVIYSQGWGRRENGWVAKKIMT